MNPNTPPIAKVIDEAQDAEICAHLADHYSDLLTPDVSNYASGRQRCWLEQEPSLTRDVTLRPAHHDERLWNWILRVTARHNWEPQLGLIARGPVGISLHRDASYADYEAFSINLGETVTWQYRECYRVMGWERDADNNAPITEIELPAGAIVRFNCKNPHGVGSVISAQRWSLNLWRLK